MGWCPAAAAALTTVIVVCLCPSWAFLHVSSTSPRAATPATTGTAGASSSFGYGSRATPTSRETFRRRASRRKEDLKRKSLSGEGGEADALLLRMDFEHGEVDEIRDWIRRCWERFSLCGVHGGRMRSITALDVKLCLLFFCLVRGCGKEGMIRIHPSRAAVKMSTASKHLVGAHYSDACCPHLRMQRCVRARVVSPARAGRHPLLLSWAWQESRRVG